MLLGDGEAGESNSIVEGAGGRISGSSSFSAAGFPHSHTSCNAVLLVTNFPKFVTASLDIETHCQALCELGVNFPHKLPGKQG